MNDRVEGNERLCMGLQRPRDSLGTGHTELQHPFQRAVRHLPASACLLPSNGRKLPRSRWA